METVKEDEEFGDVKISNEKTVTGHSGHSKEVRKSKKKKKGDWPNKVFCTEVQVSNKEQELDRQQLRRLT